jgi:hypothetical protein
MVFAPTNFIEAGWKAERLTVRNTFGGQKLPEAETNRAMDWELTEKRLTARFYVT